MNKISIETWPNQSGLKMKQPVVSVVLANLMSSKGELNAETKARIKLAAQVDSEHQSDVILLCGWAYRPDCSIALAEAMNTYISTQYPLLAKKAVSQNLSRDTVGDAFFTCLYLRELFMGYSSFNINVITSDYHVNRTCEIFDFIFGGISSICVKGLPGFNSDISATKEIESLRAFRKTFSGASAGDLDSIYFTLAKSHPFYNGTIHPRMGKMGELSLYIKSCLAHL